MTKEGHTPKDALFLQKFSEENFDPTKKLACAEQAGLGTGEKALMNAGRVLKSLQKNEKFQEELVRVGVNYNMLANKIKDLLDAESAFKDGKPDNYIQHKTLETAIKVMNLNPATKIDIDKTEHHEIVISMEVVDRLNRYEKMIEMEDKAIDAEVVALPE
jgi:hypothetical protein